MVRVAYVNHNGLISGAEISLLTLLARLDRQQFQPLLIAPDNGKLLEKAARLGVPVVALGHQQFFDKPHLINLLPFIAKFWFRVWCLSRILNQNQIELIHANNIRAGLVAGLAGVLSGRAGRIIVHVRDIPDRAIWLQRISLWGIGLLASRLICVSNFVAEQTRRQLPARFAHKVSVVYNGVLLEEAEHSLEQAKIAGSFRQELGLTDSEGPVLGVVGQLTPWKGQFEALKAFATLVKSQPTLWQTARMVIVGEAKFTSVSARYNTRDYERQLHRFVAAQGLEDQVIFTGECENIWKVYPALDMVIIPSWNEPFGRVAIEAMVAGTLVIGTKAGGIPEIIEHGRSGWLVEACNPDALAVALCTLRERPELKQAMVKQAALQVRNRFESRSRIAEIERLYRLVLDHSAPKQIPALPVKLLYINHTGQISGAEISLLRTLRSLDSARFQANLACPLNSALWQQAGELGTVQLLNLDSFTFGYRFQFGTIRAVYQACRQIYRLIQQSRPAIVHANSIRSGLICGLVRILLFLRRKPAPKLVVHIRDNLEPNLINLGVRLILGATGSCLLPVSGYVARRVRPGDWLPRPRFMVMHDGVDPNEFDPARFNGHTCRQVREQFGLKPSDYPVIGLVGQITPWKGHSEAIRAMPTVLQSFPQARLLIVGEPKFTNQGTRYNTQLYYAELKKLVSDLGLHDRVIFTGEFRNIPALMYSLDIFLLCSWVEPFGMVYIEAMAMERPVIATELGGPQDIVVEGQTGLKVRQHDPEAIARAIKRLAADPVQARQMGQRGRTRVLELFTAEQQARRLEQLYFQLVKQSL